MISSKSKILAIYRPHPIYRVLDIFFALILFLPVVIINILVLHLAVKERVILLIGLMPLSFAIVLILRAFSFRMIVTTNGIITQGLGRREIPFESLAFFDWQIPTSLYGSQFYFGIGLNRPIGTKFHGLRLVLSPSAIAENRAFLPLNYVHIPKKFGIFHRPLDVEKFLKTEFGQILWENAPQLFEEEKHKNR